MAPYEALKQSGEVNELLPTKEGCLKLYCANCQRTVAVDLPDAVAANLAKKQHARNSRNGCQSYHISHETQHTSRI